MVLSLLSTLLSGFPFFSRRERRNVERHPIRRKVQIKTAQACWRAVLLDISVTGCLLSPEFCFPTMSHFQVFIPEAGLELTVRKVRTIDMNGSIGAAFVTLSGEQERLLRAYVREVHEERSKMAA